MHYDQGRYVVGCCRQRLVSRNVSTRKLRQRPGREGSVRRCGGHGWTRSHFVALIAGGTPAFFKMVIIGHQFVKAD